MDLFGTRCLCESCSPGAIGETYSRVFLLECEARYVARMPSNEDRTRYLDDVGKIRGGNAAQRLREAAWRAMK